MVMVVMMVVVMVVVLRHLLTLGRLRRRRGIDRAQRFGRVRYRLQEVGEALGPQNIGGVG